MYRHAEAVNTPNVHTLVTGTIIAYLCALLVSLGGTVTSSEDDPDIQQIAVADSL